MMMGCGTLILTTPSDQMVLNDVPGARRVVDLFTDLTDNGYINEAVNHDTVAASNDNAMA
jgi:hypothetical protein